ncbi:MAG: ABC transporter ATP-binding protein [Moraxellaceae bacterium]|nr:ABC transporter ATP-binding protein [Pseudobdellovibrionaceae bacterium]
MKKITPQNIQVNNLSVNYGNIKAIKDISFNFRTSEITTLIGSNGAGKTTTLKALMGLLPSAGTVSVNDTRIEKLTVAGRISRGITLCPEGRGIFPNLTVHDNLMLGAYLNKNSAEIKHLLEEQLTFFPKLAERIKQIAGTLSGGEQQMLAISRALMSQPEFLLLDEPSLGLAPVIIDQIFSKFEDLKKQGLGLLIVEQNAILALEISDRAYVLETGTLTLSGTGAELLHDPRVIDAYLS